MTDPNAREGSMADNNGSLVFWRDGATSGRSGYFVRAVSLNEVVPRWIAEGKRVAGIRLDPENDKNIDVLIEDEPQSVEAPHD